MMKKNATSKNQRNSKQLTAIKYGIRNVISESEYATSKVGPIKNINTVEIEDAKK